MRDNRLHAIRVSRVRADGAVEIVAELGGGPNGAALGPESTGRGLRFYAVRGNPFKMPTVPAGVTQALAPGH